MAFESYTLAQLQTQLTNVQAAIDRTLNAEEYAIGSRNLRRPSLDALMKREQALSREIAVRQDPSGGVGLVEFQEPA